MPKPDPLKILNWHDVRVRAVADRFPCSVESVYLYLKGQVTAPPRLFEAVAELSPAAANALRPLLQERVSS